MRMNSFLKIFLMLGAALSVMAASAEKVPQELLDHSDFYAKMDMIENITVVENLTDEDMQVVLNTSAPLPKTAQLEENITVKPEEQAEGQ